ncbi:methyltransferase, putative [Bodo saltans]|uniref:Methyltransferase, putative n=1 Tax=Bodo saltans TaxID=75058 RepID=A0A0S4IJP7_BODSA|nr:methyltransferase, putative [Bodo saltans]|eukprot:CUE91335.1 methyltransferase, putative [Bodo saltans]
MPEYGKADYWDERYKSNDTTFDWFVAFEPLRDVLQSLAKPDYKILVIGCGNSRLSPQLYESGYQNVVNIDISEVVVNQMRARYKELDRMEWLKMDVMKLEFPDNHFDLVIDKGTVDSLLCGGNSFHNVYMMNKNVSRVMKRGARYVVVTYGQPDTRIDHYRRKRLHFEVEHRTIDKPVFSSDASPTSNYHVYVMTKTEDSHAEEDAEDEDEEDDDFYDKFQANIAN